MLRPSRPMMRPFMSSDGSSTTVTVRLSGVARGHPLERVGDEVPGSALRLGARLLLEHPDAPGEIVADELLAPLEQVRLRVLLAHARDPLELGLLALLCLLHLVLELAQMRLAVGEALVAARELDELLLDLLLLREHPLLDLQHLLAAVGELGVDLRPELHRLLARLDLGFATDRLRLALGILEQLIANPAGLRDPGRPEHGHREERECHSGGDPDGDSDPDQHVRSSSLEGLSAASGTSNPASSRPGYSRTSLCGASVRAGRARLLAGGPPPVRRSRNVGIVESHNGDDFGKNRVCRQNVGCSVAGS